MSKIDREGGLAMGKRLTGLLLALALWAGLLCACAGTPAAARTPSGQDAEGNWIFDNVVTVGRVAPMTGPLSSFGAGTPYVEQLAVDAVNAQGGVVLDGKRCRLELVYVDSRSDVQRAAAAARDLIRSGVDIMIVSNTADTVSPVTAACERAGIACISVDAPASAWIMGGPYQNSWHTFFDNEHEMLCFLEAWNSIESNRTIGLLTANDGEGVEIATFIRDFAAANGYAIVDPGSYPIGEDSYADYVDAFAAAGCDIIVGVMNTVDFSVFWRECMAGDYRPKMCTMAKACLFSADVEDLGELADGLITEVWWNRDFPFTSSINGWTCAQLADDYQANCDGSDSVVPPTIGYKHANIEILYDILKRAGSLSLDAVNAAAAATELDTVVGHVSFNGEHVSVMSCVTGQWRRNEDGTYRQEIVGNYLMPGVEITADLILIPEKEGTE